MSCILLLEDNKVTSAQMLRSLKLRFPHAHLLSAGTLGEARVYAGEIAIDVCILDIQLPDGSGIDFLTNDIRVSQPQAKAILMTASPLPEYQAMAEKLGVVRFMKKPVNLDLLSELIEGALEPEKTGKNKSHFAGALSALTAFDVVQLKCMGHATEVMRFVSKVNESGMNLSGWIHFSKGQVVHAASGELSGVDAFYQIVGWQGGHFEEMKEPPETSPTIFSDWQSLLMSAAQHMDQTLESTARTTV